MTDKLQIFYRVSDNKILWVTPAGDMNEPTGCILLTDQADINTFLASDDNKVVDGKLIIGVPRLVASDEVEDIKSRLLKLEG